MEVSFQIFGEKLFERDIERIEIRAVDARPVLRHIGEKWLDWNEEQFLSGGRRASGGWPALSPRTVARKGHATILVDTARLFEEMISPRSLSVSDEFLHFNLADDRQKIAGIHQKGSPETNLPQRKVLEWTELDKQWMAKALQLWFFRGDLLD